MFILTSKAGCTLAQEPVDPVHTFAAVVARLRATVVDVLATVRAFESLLANARVQISRVDAGASVLARIGLASVQLSCRNKREGEELIHR